AVRSGRNSSSPQSGSLTHNPVRSGSFADPPRTLASTAVSVRTATRPIDDICRSCGLDSGLSRNADRTFLPLVATMQAKRKSMMARTHRVGLSIWNLLGSCTLIHCEGQRHVGCRSLSAPRRPLEDDRHGRRPTAGKGGNDIACATVSCQSRRTTRDGKCERWDDTLQGSPGKSPGDGLSLLKRPFSLRQLMLRLTMDRLLVDHVRAPVRPPDLPNVGAFAP